MLTRGFMTYFDPMLTAQAAQFSASYPSIAQRLAATMSGAIGNSWRAGYHQGFAAGLTHPRCCHLPRPRPQLSGAPAGRGLTKDPAGWPKGAIRTAGGYVVVPEGKGGNWNIYAPGQKHGDKPHTRIWGDPHVNEKDGTRWDFTKSSDFVLPDGTRIFAKTSSETGQSFTTGLTLTNGVDRVNVSGLKDGPLNVGPVTYDGYEWRARHLANPNRPVFRLGGDNDLVKWFREKNGRIEGLVTGARYDGNKRQYVQKVDRNEGFTVDPTMRPPIGSPAWGNLIRGFAADRAGATLDAPFAELYGRRLHADHQRTRLMQPFGGLGRYFGNWSGVMGSLQSLGRHLFFNQALTNHAFAARLGWLPA
ncbi:MAG: DUF1521 domain-containing protein [Deltaproteobacteria bacterium]